MLTRFKLLPDGAFQIIDRKKNIFKYTLRSRVAFADFCWRLAQGEYVAAEELENVFHKVPHASQLWIYGDSFHNTLIAVIVPSVETFPEWLNNNGIEGNFTDAVQHEKVCGWPRFIA